MTILKKRSFTKAIILAFLVAPILWSCNDEAEETSKPTITEFSPSSGVVGEVVTIKGSNFSSTAAKNVVKFNGALATVTEATSTQLTVSVPAEATSGAITLSVNGAATASSSEFTIPDPTIASYAPAIAGAGVPVKITGTNFSSINANNIVKFNGINATVTSSSATELTAVVPAGTTSGTITVSVGTNTASSSSNIEICSSSELMISDVVIQNTAGASSYFLSMKITNVGSTSADITKVLIQNYASTDGVIGNDVSSGGYMLVNGPTALLPGETYSMVNYNFNLGTGRNTNTHPYAVITMSSNSVTECHTDDNIVLKQFN